MMLINDNHSSFKYDESSNADKETDDLKVEGTVFLYGLMWDEND